MSQTSTVLVTGAGVDKTAGIDFPLAADLLPAINNYLAQDEEGRAVDALLREKIKGLRFRFDRFINQAITEIAHREPEQLRATIERINQVVNRLPDDECNRIPRIQGQLIVRLFDQLQKIAAANQIDEETRSLIEEVFEDEAAQFDLDDHVVDIRTLSIGDTFKSILRHPLRQSLESGANQIAHALGADLLDIEQLLIEKFLGFYNNRMSDIKNYVYIAWCFWAFLVHKDKMTKLANSTMPFYCGIPGNWRGITLNYTSFLESRLGAKNVVYFHGGLNQYVRMDNRELLRFDNFEMQSPKELLESHICGNWLFDDDNPSGSRCLIPSLVPPLRLKPILSKEYIDLWYHASEWLQDAGHIVLMGYSLNAADEHFNDLLRAVRGKRITVIGPDVLTPAYLARVNSVWSISENQFTGTVCQGYTAKKSGDLLLVQAKAHEVNLVELT